MAASSTDRIEKQVIIRAPRARVWRAISDWKQFGEWFRVDLRQPFTPGARVTGRITHPGYEHLEMELTVDRIEPERRFSYRWHPYAVEPGRDYSGEPTTLVVFELEEVPEGTRLTVTESGFDGIPLARRDEAFRMNEQGWTIQVDNVAQYVAGRA